MAILAPLRSRRLVPWLAGLGLTALVIYVIVRLLAFAQLFGKLGPHAGIEITQEQVMMLHNATDPDPRTPLIPQIVHQIFHNWKEPGKHDIPEDWARMRQSCIDRNPGWDVKVCLWACWPGSAARGATSPRKRPHVVEPRYSRDGY